MDNILEYKDCLSTLMRVPSINIFGKKIGYNEAPLFTIAIPTYKRVATLSETLESALCQKGIDSYNVIVVDNNPDRGDETELFMARFREHPKVLYYKNSQNVGMAGNWNKCLTLADSNNVILIHDDDVMSCYCLSMMNTLMNKISKEWAMVKPNLIKFTENTELNFVKPKSAKLYKLIPYHFYDSCPIGAPSVILLNKRVILQSGGYNQEYYPSFDYAMSARMALTKSLYFALFDSPLGGYRIGLNESLSHHTMDKFYEMRYRIANAFCAKKHIPPMISKLIHSILNESCVKSETSYYGLNDYKFNNKYDFWRFPSFIDNILKYVYNSIFRLPVLFNRRRISL